MATHAFLLLCSVALLLSAASRPGLSFSDDDEAAVQPGLTVEEVPEILDRSTLAPCDTQEPAMGGGPQPQQQQQQQQQIPGC
ncbi:hypothetical protein CRUP_016177 [Coryphaenoides rupestris]|nr:hypothetical protein CRUP_016177 [Coryphaenoides rupestris]